MAPSPSEDLQQALADGVTRSGYHKDFLASIGGEEKAHFVAGQRFFQAYKEETLEVRELTALDNGWVDARKIGRNVGYASLTIHCAKLVRVTFTSPPMAAPSSGSMAN